MEKALEKDLHCYFSSLSSFTLRPPRFISPLYLLHLLQCLHSTCCNLFDVSSTFNSFNWITHLWPNIPFLPLFIYRMHKLIPMLRKNKNNFRVAAWLILNSKWLGRFGIKFHDLITIQIKFKSLRLIGNPWIIHTIMNSLLYFLLGISFCFLHAWIFLDWAIYAQVPVESS